MMVLTTDSLTDSIQIHRIFTSGAGESWRNMDIELFSSYVLKKVRGSQERSCQLEVVGFELTTPEMT